jgi:hypothetical protein
MRVKVTIALMCEELPIIDRLSEANENVLENPDSGDKKV